MLLGCFTMSFSFSYSFICVLSPMYGQWEISTFVLCMQWVPNTHKNAFLSISQFLLSFVEGVLVRLCEDQTTWHFWGAGSATGFSCSHTVALVKGISEFPEAQFCSELQQEGDRTPAFPSCLPPSWTSMVPVESFLHNFGTAYAWNTLCGTPKLWWSFFAEAVSVWKNAVERKAGVTSSTMSQFQKELSSWEL